PQPCRTILRSADYARTRTRRRHWSPRPGITVGSRSPGVRDPCRTTLAVRPPATVLYSAAQPCAVSISERPANVNIQTNITRYWDGRARAYDAHQQRDDRHAADRAAWSRVLTHALNHEVTDVLDLGTGSGYLAFRLADLGYTVTATDLSEGMLSVAADHAQERAEQGQPNPTFQTGDAVAPSFGPETFDAVTNRYVMWTLRNPLAALLNWKQLLRPGGQLLVVDAPWFPNGIEANTTEGFVEHYGGTVAEALPLAQARSIEDTLAIVRQAGFQHVTATPLTEIFTLDQATGVAPGHHVQMQHLITATKAPALDAGTEHSVIADAAVANMEPSLHEWT